MCRAVITLTNPPDSRWNTTKAKRPSSASGSPDLAVAGEDLLHLFRGESTPLDVEDVVVFPSNPETTTVISYQVVYTKRYDVER
jgi:hypothetical protein